MDIFNRDNYSASAEARALMDTIKEKAEELSDLYIRILNEHPRSMFGEARIEHALKDLESSVLWAVKAVCIAEREAVGNF